MTNYPDPAVGYCRKLSQNKYHFEHCTYKHDVDVKEETVSCFVEISSVLQTANLELDN